MAHPLMAARMQMIGTVPLFRLLEPAALLKLAERAEQRSYPAGVRIIREDEPGTSLFFVLSGVVKVSILTMNGRELSLALLSRGEFFGEMSVLDGQPRSAMVTAIEPAEVVELSRNAFLRCLEECPEAALALLAELSQRLRHGDRLLAQLANAPMRTRLLQKLAELGEQFGRRTVEGIELGIRLRQQDLADFVGSSRERMNQELRQLRREGLVRIERQRITLIAAGEVAVLLTA